MQVVLKVVRSSSFWAAVLGGIAAGLESVGVISPQVLESILGFIAFYIPIRVAGDVAKAKINSN